MPEGIATTSRLVPYTEREEQQQEDAFPSNPSSRKIQRLLEELRDEQDRSNRMCKRLERIVEMQTEVLAEIDFITTRLRERLRSLEF
jgi:hypothetical protein